MVDYHCVRIRPNHYECSTIGYSKQKVVFKQREQYQDIEYLKQAIANKSQINFLLYDDQFLKSSIALSRKITGRSAINGAVYSKLQKEHKNIDKIRFKYSLSEDNPKKDTLKYAIHGLYQDSSSYKKFNEIKTFENCNLVTLENYALYEFSKQQLPQMTFISIWADETTMSIVVGDSKELHYSRNENFQGGHYSLEQEISKNILFAQQRARDLKFDTIVINGSVFADESLYQAVYEQMRIPVSSFRPDLLVYENFTSVTFNENLIAIASLYVGYEMDFTSKYIKAHIQYNRLLKYFLVAMVVLSSYSVYDFFQSYSHFKKLNTQYTQELESLVSLSDNFVIKTKNKEETFTLLDTMKEKGNENLFLQIKKIKENIEEANKASKYINIDISLDNFEWKHQEVSKLSYTLNSKFPSLKDLNELRKELNILEKKLKGYIQIEPNFQLNELSGSITYTFYGEKK